MKVRERLRFFGTFSFLLTPPTEANYYQTDGTYQGGVDDYLTGWKTVATACKQYAPEVKSPRLCLFSTINSADGIAIVFWSMNIANDQQYAEYFPGNDYVDVVGVDWYPTSSITTGMFASQVCLCYSVVL